MDMIKRIINIGGNSEGVIIDKGILKKLKKRKGDYLKITISKQGDKR